MRLSAIAVSAFAVVAFQCGGQVDEQCPTSSNDSCVQEGKACNFPMTVCGQQETDTCTCKDGHFQCPVHAGDCPVQGCALDTYPGASCSQPGLQCESMQQSSCVDTPIWCTCNGSTFQCAIPDCPPPPPCPPPDSIVPGDSCDVYQAQCSGPMGAQCFCAGTWQCELDVDAGPPIDAGESD